MTDDSVLILEAKSQAKQQASDSTVKGGGAAAAALLMSQQKQEQQEPLQLEQERDSAGSAGSGSDSSPPPRPPLAPEGASLPAGPDGQATLTQVLASPRDHINSGQDLNAANHDGGGGGSATLPGWGSLMAPDEMGVLAAAATPTSPAPPDLDDLMAELQGAAAPQSRSQR